MGDLSLDTLPRGGEGRYTITLSRDWEIWGPNGGYLAAVALRAAGLEAQIKRPASIACHFLAVAKFEPAEITVQRVQSGRRAESIHVTMTQDGRDIVQAIVRTAAVVPGVEHDFGVMPEVPPPSQLRSFLDHWPDAPPGPNFWNNVDSRIVNPERINDMENPHEPNVIEWYRFQPRPTFDDPFADACRSVVLLDTFAWPASANPHPQNTRRFQAVNLDVVAWFHQPANTSEWLLCEYRGLIAQDGLVSAHGRVWSEDGRLIASGGAQCICIPAG